jgi:hypothetical protein
MNRLPDRLATLLKAVDQPIINTAKDEFETLVVEMPSARNATGKKPIAVVESQD